MKRYYNDNTRQYPLKRRHLGEQIKILMNSIIELLLYSR